MTDLKLAKRLSKVLITGDSVYTAIKEGSIIRSVARALNLADDIYEVVKEAKVPLPMFIGGMRTVMYHNFKTSGLYSPTIKGWGGIKIGTEGLELSPDSAYCGVLFTPITHKGSVFALETKVKLGTAGLVQILDRLDSAVDYEMGMTLGKGRSHVAYQINHQYVSWEGFKLDPDPNAWYVMRFEFINGIIKGYVDGRSVYISSQSFPIQTTFAEPHLASFGGTAIFEYIKIEEG